METLFKETEGKMDKAIEALKNQFAQVRTGRANPAILDNISVDYYGTQTALNQVGNISIPDPQLILISPWEKSMLNKIEKAILQSSLGITPQNDGNVIRLPIPPLTEERRKQMVKQIKKMGEEAKIPIRNARREANDKLKKMEKNKEISQDDQKKHVAKVQTITDDRVKSVGQLVEEKEKELMEI